MLWKRLRMYTFVPFLNHAPFEDVLCVHLSRGLLDDRFVFIVHSPGRLPVTKQKIV